MSIRELVESWRPRYLWANRKEKGRILDEFVRRIREVTLRHAGKAWSASFSTTLRSFHLTV
ncbi:MAG: hypothetical protein QXQ66_07815 [Candidatus Hadarchaeum sp.]|uniref:hypothetical protein n=1 Tax=Candidatus Hadarchaeum sp. TaxID=2883567 RepID=UPI00316B1C8D